MNCLYAGRASHNKNESFGIPFSGEWYESELDAFRGMLILKAEHEKRFVPVPIYQYTVTFGIETSDRNVLVPSTTATPPTTSLLRERHNSSLHIQ